jgi:hypothetical protein
VSGAPPSASSGGRGAFTVGGFGASPFEPGARGAFTAGGVGAGGGRGALTAVGVGAGGALIVVGAGVVPGAGSGDRGAFTAVGVGAAGSVPPAGVGGALMTGGVAGGGSPTTHAVTDATPMPTTAAP